MPWWRRRAERRSPFAVAHVTGAAVTIRFAWAPPGLPERRRAAGGRRSPPASDYAACPRGVGFLAGVDPSYVLFARRGYYRAVTNSLHTRENHRYHRSRDLPVRGASPDQLVAAHAGADPT